MVIPSWITVLKWLGVAAVAVAVLGTPVVYHNHAVSKAYEQGKVVGEAEGKSKMFEVAQKQFKLQEGIILSEAQKARTLAAKLAKTEAGASVLEQKLNEELAKTPTPVECKLGKSVTSILRNAADGDFDQLDDPVSGAGDDPVSHESPLLGEGRANSS